MEFQAHKKPECYSPGRTNSFQEIAENDCFLVGSIEIDLDAPLVDEEDSNGCLED